MKRIISFEENSANGRNLLALVSKMKDPEVRVSEPFAPLSESEWVNAGPPATDAQIEYLLNENELGTMQASDVVEQYTKRKK